MGALPIAPPDGAVGHIEETAMGIKTDRRSMLRLSAVAAAGTLFAGCAAPQAGSQPGPKQQPAGGGTPAAALPAGTKFKEAPMLADLVKAGKLPPVEQRVPSSPRVIKPNESVGQFGGVWHRAYSGLSDYVGPGKLMEAYLIKWDAPNPNTLGLANNVLDSW